MKLALQRSTVYVIYSIRSRRMYSSKLVLSGNSFYYYVCQYWDFLFIFYPTDLSNLQMRSLGHNNPTTNKDNQASLKGRCSTVEVTGAQLPG